MRVRYEGIVTLCLLFIIVFFFAFVLDNEPTISIIGGEGSVGSWMSGCLLIISSTLCGVIASRRSRYLWLLFSVFFMLLAVDENFMIHEAIKRMIIFSNYEKTKEPVYWIGEIPVVIAACVGAVIAFLLWRNSDQRFRWLIIPGVIFGTISVVMDVMSLGVLLEDSCKLIGELFVAGLIVMEVQNKNP